MKWLFVLLGPLAAMAADAPRVYYSKSFPGSTPAFVAITVEKHGAIEYKEAPDDAMPVKLRLAEPEAGQIFELAGKLQYFKRSLEAPVKVANMGMKTFRWENGAEVSEVKFNFSQDLDARALQDWFERIAETAQNFINLERTMKYDKLGVMKALLNLEASRDRNRLVAHKDFLPMLDRVAKNETYLHIARSRAAGLAESIRAAK
ncbi:MAG: hypothetical protein IT158_28295 [Bryobacterales bacterium]|nr:hypothetical protein [Bryobacterales bacterium]